MIVQIKTEKEFNYFLLQLKKLVEKFVLKTKSEHTVEQTINLIYQRIFDQNTLILLKLNIDYIAV